MTYLMTYLIMVCVYLQLNSPLHSHATTSSTDVTSGQKPSHKSNEMVYYRDYDTVFDF